MSMEDLEKLDSLTLSRMGLWRCDCTADPETKSLPICRHRPRYLGKELDSFLRKKEPSKSTIKYRDLFKSRRK